jgi:hypothetical protein
VKGVAQRSREGGLVLDAGALIAFERNDRFVLSLLAECKREGAPIVIPAGALGQVWRDGRTQVQLSRLVKAVATSVEALDHRRACAAGQLCGRARTKDLIDASVVLAGREHRASIATSDPDDLKRLDPDAALIVV